MAYRNGNYIAFDGLGQTDPTKSDFRYYSTIKAWASDRDFDFKYVDSHAKTNAVRDTSRRPTLETRIRERLASSKNVIVILSDQTRRTGSMLSYEIEKAIDRYQLPLICVYTGYNRIMKPAELSNRWPASLEERIRTGTAQAIHIPFKKYALLDALGQFTVHHNNLQGGLNHYNQNAHQQFGCI